MRTTGLVTAAYYRALADDLFAQAAAAEDAAIAARMRRSAEEYLVLARELDLEEEPQTPPTATHPEPQPDQPAQQQQQIQPKKEDE
jgi:ABC-type sugar transport system substrate-binding protein